MNKKGSRANAAPLLSWDIFMDTVHRRELLSEDIDSIRQISRSRKWPPLDVCFENALIWENKTIIITDPSLTILFATQNIARMTGYEPSDVIGKTPKIFQGKATSTKQRDLIREAVKKQQPFSTTITNYKKDGSPYECQIDGYPVFNAKNELVNFIAFEKAA